LKPTFGIAEGWGIEFRQARRPKLIVAFFVNDLFISQIYNVKLDMQPNWKTES